MAPDEPFTLPVLQPLTTDRSLRGRWKTVIFNNDHNSMDEVMLVLMAATGCSAEEAEIETWEAHHYGAADVHFAPRIECEAAAKVISAIGVQTDVRPEWDDEEGSET